MGMYTELVFKASFSDDIPDQVHAVLCHLFAGGDRPEVLPDHPFFLRTRWCSVGRSSSFYHTPFPLSHYEDPNRPGEKGGYVFSRSDLKDYDNEIAMFLDWIDPFIDAPSGLCIGWTWYEEDDQPTLVFKK